MRDATPDFVFPDDPPPVETPRKPAEAPPGVPATAPAPAPVKAVSESPVAPVAPYDDPAGLPVEGRALLRALSGGEAQDYNVLYGGGRFTDFSDHPRRNIPILSGPNAGKTSSAAGHYQMLADTWDEAAEAVGAKDFSPANQDKAAWWLAQRDYTKRTGRDLLADLKAGNVEGIARALSGTWTSLPGGIEQTVSAAGFRSRYEKAYGAPVGPAPLFPDSSLYTPYRQDSPAANQQSAGNSFVDAASAALRYETVTGILADHLAQPAFKPDPGFTWSMETQKAKFGDLPKAEQDYIRESAVSGEHADWLRSRALDKLNADKALAEQGFLGSTALMFGAGMVDLPGYLAGGVAGRALFAGRQLGRAARIGAHAGTFAAAAAPLEITKYALDHDYDAGDVARGLAMASLFGGGFGAFGAAGPAMAQRFRGFVDNSLEKTSAWEAAEAARAKYTADVGAAVAPEVPPVIEPTWLDRFGTKMAKTLDFSVGGRLYHSNNDLISELAPKLTTVATQDLTKGARDVEGALDFVHRHTATFNMRVEDSLRKWYEPWAQEQGLNVYSKVQQQGAFYDQAARLHTDPAANLEDFDKNVVGFVGDMRKIFSDHLELAQAHGLEAAKTLTPDAFYLPRYFDRVKWRAMRSQHGIEGLEEVVANAIKKGDPQIAARVGSRIVGRAAERDASKVLSGSRPIDPITGERVAVPSLAKQAVTDSENAATEAAVKTHKDSAKADLEAVESKRTADNASAALDRDDKLTAQKAAGESDIDPNSPLSREGIRQSVEQEVEHWRQQEREVRDAANSLPAAAKGQRARLLAEADDLKAFHEGLHGEAEAAWQDAAQRIGKTIEQDQHAARVEAEIRRKSTNKEAEREGAAIREERDASVKASREAGEHVKAAELAEIKTRYWLEAFSKRMEKFEEKFVRRVSRKYVETVDNSVEGKRPDIDTAFSTRDTKLVREALQRNGIVVDEQLADQLADMIAPRAQRGPQNMRRRTVLDENAAFSPGGTGPDGAFSMRDLMETDYGKIVDRYTRTMAPNYIMSTHGFQSESSLRKYIADVTAEHKGIDGYRDINAYRDKRRANYLVDLIYGHDPMPNVDPRVKAVASVLSNFNYARVGGSFGMAQTYDSAELVLRHGFEAFRRGVPAWDEMISAIKHGGPEAAGLVRDFQLFIGLGIKGAEAKLIPNFRGLDSILADDLTGTYMRKAMRTSKSLSNAVGHLSALNTLTDVQHVAAARIFLQTIKDVHAGRRTLSERLMADFGLSPEKMTKFGALLDHAKVDSEGIIRDLNTDLLRKVDLKTFDELMGLTRREAFRTIIEPHAGLMPMLAGTSLFGKFAFQLKSFAAVSNAVHTLGNLRLGPTYVAKSVIGGAAWAAPLYAMWTYYRTIGLSPEEREKRLEKAFEPSKMAFNVWNRVGMAGVTPEVIGTAIQAGQKFGLIAPEGEGNQFGQAARASGLVAGGINSIPVVDMMGALLDSLQTGVDAVQNHRGLTRYEARRMMSLIPGQNAGGILQAINAATTGLPERKE